MGKHKMIFPCCFTELPAPLDGVELATCPCGMSYIPSVIIAYNEMIQIIADWNSVVCGQAEIKAEPGEAEFIAKLMRRGLKHTPYYNSYGERARPPETGNPTRATK